MSKPEDEDEEEKLVRRQDVLEMAQELYFRHCRDMQPKDAFFYAVKFYEAYDEYVKEDKSSLSR